MTSIWQTHDGKRKRIPCAGVGVDPQANLEELYDFFEEHPDFQSEWALKYDRVSEAMVNRRNEFYVINRHSGVRVLHIGLEL